MKHLTSKEEEVLERIWQLGESAPKDVVATYPSQQPHVNTIASVFQSLERKRVLTHKAVGRGYIYSATISKEEYGKGVLRLFADRFFGNSYMKIISSLVAEEKVSRSELIEVIDKRKEGDK